MNASRLRNKLELIFNEDENNNKSKTQSRLIILGLITLTALPIIFIVLQRFG